MVLCKKQLPKPKTLWSCKKHLEWNCFCIISCSMIFVWSILGPYGVITVAGYHANGFPNGSLKGSKPTAFMGGALCKGKEEKKCKYSWGSQGKKLCLLLLITFFIRMHIYVQLQVQTSQTDLFQKSCRMGSDLQSSMALRWQKLFVMSRCFQFNFFSAETLWLKIFK